MSYEAEIDNDSVGFFGWCGCVDSVSGVVGDEVITARYPKKHGARTGLRTLCNRLEWGIGRMEDKTV